MPTYRVRRPVRRAYTFKRVKRDVSHLHTRKRQPMSLHAIAHLYGVTHGAVQRVIAGQEPKRLDIRLAFGLSVKRATTFEEHAAEYEAWKVAHADELNALVAWCDAETDLP